MWRARTPFADDLIDFGGAVYRELDGDADLLAGIRVMATPGHTPGHQSLVVVAAWEPGSTS